MATKAVAEKTETQNGSGDSPLLDTLNAEVKKVIAHGKERGYVTYDELNAALPPDQVSSEQIEELQISKMILMEWQKARFTRSRRRIPSSSCSVLW